MRPSAAVLGACFGVCALASASEARADQTLFERLLPLVPLNFLPAGIGPEFVMGPRATSDVTVVIAWPMQFQPGPEPHNIGVNHRVVVAPELLAGNQHAPDPDRSVEGSLRLRAGYRAVWHPDGGLFGVLAGAGTTLEVWPSIRPSLSPEIGGRIGRPEGVGVVSLVVRFDQYFFGGENPTRLSVVAGWSFY